MTQDRIRNFSIIAHIDHGKSTLADRILELTHAVSSREMREQVLDTMELERERGITIKAQAVRVEWKGHQLNLIDTPGHVDFTYEVSRSLQACEGALLLVDAAQGTQAQTLANAWLAIENDLEIVPVVNKIDLPQASPDAAAAELADLVGDAADHVLRISAKTGEGVAFVRVVDGRFSPREPLRAMALGTRFEAEELGFFAPMRRESRTLEAGEVGDVITGLKDVSKLRVGDTITSERRPAAEPLPGYKDVKPMVFAGLFPTDSDTYPELREALEREFALDLLVTAPNVAYRVNPPGGEWREVHTPADMPAEVEEVEEPYIKASIIVPTEYVGTVMELNNERRGRFDHLEYLSEERVHLTYELPLAEIVLDYYDRLKSRTRGD